MSTLGEQFDSIRPLVQLFSVDDFDAPPMVEAKFDLVPVDGAVALPVGDKGPDGDQGEPGLPIRFRGHVTSDAELPDESILNQYDEGKAWANVTTGSIWLWTADGWMEIPDGLGVPGPVGPPGTIGLGTVTTSPPDGFASVEAVGSALSRTLNITLPRGPKGLDGDVGPSGPIRSASDYSDVTAPSNGDIPQWDSTINKYKPVTPKRMVGPFTLINTDFSTAAVSTGSNVVGSRAIPAQAFKYRFWISGLLSINAPNTASQVDVRVVPQSAGSSAVALGRRDYGAGVRAATFTRAPGGKLSPGSTVNEMPAGVPQTLNVEVVRTGSGSYNVVSDPFNGIEVWLIPT